MPPRRDDNSRYEVTAGNSEASFYDDEKQVLVNKLHIRDPDELGRKEEEGLARAYLRFAKDARSSPQPITSELLKTAHLEIFGELYEWAGRWRTVNISKDRMTWPPPMFLDESMGNFERDVLAKYPTSLLDSDESFCEALAVIQGEFLAVHPFREGNARTIKLCTNLLSLQTGRPILAYNHSKEGRDDYIRANQLVCHKKDYCSLIAIGKDALSRARMLQRQRRAHSPEEPKDRLTQALESMKELGQDHRTEELQKSPDRTIKR